MTELPVRIASIARSREPEPFLHLTFDRCLEPIGTFAVVPYIDNRPTKTARPWVDAAYGHMMQTNIHSMSTKSPQRPMLKDARKPDPAPKALPGGLTREELRKIVLEVLG